MGRMATHMYVVIPTAVEATNTDLALAIETIRHHTSFDVITIGHDHGLTDHIPTVQGPNQWANTDLAMRTACQQFQSFIWSADDIYWTRPAQPIRWAIGKLGTTLRRGLHGLRKDATHAWLQAHGLPTWDYEAHVPMPINAAPMLEALSIVAGTNLDKLTIYGNTTGEPDTIAPDVKLRERDTTIPNTPWVASHDHGNRDLVHAHVRECMALATSTMR